MKKNKVIKTPKSEKAILNKGKVFWNSLSIYFIIRKAKKMCKRIKVDPNYYLEEQRYKFVKKVAKKLLYLTDSIVAVKGIENWLDKGIVLAPNHQSNFDPIILMAINDFNKQQPLAFIAKKELWSMKLFKHFMPLIDNIPLDRENPRSALNAMKEGKELINEYKRSLTIFPEGTRSKDGVMSEWQGAALKVAQMSYSPVIPVSIIDSWKIFNKDTKTKKNIIKVIFGKPFLPERFISIKTENLTENVKKEVQKNIDKYTSWDPTKDTPIIIDKKNRVKYYK